jgi:hypothetical protein
MTSGGQQSTERLRDYLRALTPEARAMLIAELERGLLRGEEVAGNDLVLQELRRAIRGAEQAAPRVGDAARLFFAPLEPFLTDDAVDHKRVGRLARVSLDPIWGWIGRDLMPAEARTLSEDINRALLADDRLKADQLTRVLQERAIQRIRETIDAVAGDEKARRRLAVQVGTPRALDDLNTVTRVLAIRDVLGNLARRLPDHTRAFEREQIDAVKALLDGATSPRSPDGAARKADVLLYGLVLVMGRIEAPWQLIRIASRAAESDDTARVSETPFAVAVTIVLSEVECMVRELRVQLKAHRPVTSLLKRLHDAARGLRTELDLSVDSPWSRQLTTIRTEISNLLKTEIDAAPGRVRRLLRPRPAKEIVPGSLLDAIDVGDAEVLVDLVGACHRYASELAINEATMRSYVELREYLETGTKVLLDTLRQAGDGDRPFRQCQVEAAVRFCRTLFGADYAGLLAKAAEMAVQAGSADRKSVRA